MLNISVQTVTLNVNLVISQHTATLGENQMCGTEHRLSAHLSVKAIEHCRYM